MRETRAAFALLIFIIAAHIAYLLPQVNTDLDVTANYSAVTCPSPVNGARGTVLLPSKSIGIRNLTSQRSDFQRSGSGTKVISNDGIVVTGDPRSSIELQTKDGKWTSAITCASGETVSWFVGGTANVTSQGKLLLVNSGLSAAAVEVTSFSENGPQTPSTYEVKPLSERSIRIDSFEPGAERLVIRVEVISGRVTSYLTDERVRGLNNVGGDYVSPIQRPASEIIIPALPARFSDGDSIKHSIRGMSTDEVDATVSIEVVSLAGVFVPVGLGEIEIPGRQVVDIPIKDIDLGKKSLGVRISSSSPIVGSVFTEVRSGSVSDFMWSTAAPEFTEVAFNLYGLEPVITFIGDRIDIVIERRTRTGKVERKTLIGSEILNWKVPPDTRLITIANRSNARAGMYWKSKDGVAHLPIYRATTLDSSTRPIADIAVIQPRS